VFGVVFVLILMRYVGYYNFYIATWQSIFEQHSSPFIGQDTHSMSELLWLYIKNTISVVMATFIIVSTTFFSMKYTSVYRIFIAFLILFSIVFLAVANIFPELVSPGVGLVLQGGHNYWSWWQRFTKFWVFVEIGLCYFALVLIVFGIIRNVATSIRTAAFLALMAIFLTPLGSNIGFVKSIGAVVICTPFVFYLLGRLYASGLEILILNRIFLLNLTDDQKPRLKRLLYSMLLIIISMIYTDVDLESTRRFELRYEIDTNATKNVYTSQENAAHVSELYREVASKVNKNDYLLILTNDYYLYYLTHTRPFLYTPELVFYSDATKSKFLDKKLSEDLYLPLIVTPKYQNKIPDELFAKRLIEQKYKKIYTGKHFELYQPLYTKGAK
jgi:hypothetical protein